VQPGGQRLRHRNRERAVWRKGVVDGCQATSARVKGQHQRDTHRRRRCPSCWPGCAPASGP
jgi:hypothetical protein